MEMRIERAGSRLDAKNGSAGSADPSYRRRVEAVQDALQERFGCRLMKDHGLEDRYGVTFVVERLPEVDTVLNVGVAIARSSGDLEHQSQCADTTRRNVVARLLFVELGDEAEEIGAPALVYTALGSLVFDQQYRDLKAAHLHFDADASFRITPLEEQLRRLQRVDSRAHLPDERLDGTIVAYFADKGFGFIESEDHEKYFFHIAHVEDDELRTRLPGFLPGERVNVGFRYGGHDGKKYPKAVEIQYPDEDRAAD